MGPAGLPPTFGVEEEFALLDPVTGAVAPVAPTVVRECGSDRRVVAESMTYMVETRSPVCRTLDAAGDALRSSRRRVAAAARRHGAVSVACGLPPFGFPDPPLVTDAPRYRELAERYPHAMRTAGTCGCHVHVAVPTRRLGVHALGQVGRWLPALAALTANSPIADGRDSSWASRRFNMLSRWPTAVPPPPARTVADYDGLVQAAVAGGDALDVRSVYFLARLSPRYPTLEVRIADVGLTADETLAFAGLVRALVGSALDDAARERPVAAVGQEALSRACREAARGGLTGVLPDPASGRPIPAWDVVDALIAQVRPYLHRYGDEAAVLSTIHRLRLVGGGAARQRHLFAHASSGGHFVAALAAASASRLGPAPGS